MSGEETTVQKKELKKARALNNATLNLKLDRLLLASGFS